MDPRYADLETPSLIIDCAKALQNIRSMQQMANDAGCALRPHIKTHKMPLFAKLQVENGAVGITCAKVGEAEIMARAGIDDIFVAYPIVDLPRLRRAAALLPRCKRLILAVDSKAGAQRMNDFAVAQKLRFEVRLEVDTGAKRTGAAFESAIQLARRISALPGLRLTGVYTFKSMVLDGQPTTDPLAAGQEEGRLMALLRERLENAGLRGLEISAGSTPTAASVAGTGCVDEIRPGTYIFNDHMLMCEGAATPEQIAARLLCTVVSTPQPGYAVLDGGCKCFSTDFPLNAPPYYYEGYALAENRPNLVLDRLNEEHGILRSKRGSTGLAVGQQLFLTPVHICTTLNLQNTVVLDWGDRLERRPVAARGMLV